MDAHMLSAHAISERARAERLYLHYALALAALFAVCGAILAVLALGDRLDVVVKGDGGVNARILNAAPGLALCLAAAALMVVSRPRRSQLPSTPGADTDELDRRIDRALSARMGAPNYITGLHAEAASPPRSMLNHIAGNLADALEQSALEALAALRQVRDAESPAQDSGKPAAPVNGGT